MVHVMFVGRRDDGAGGFSEERGTTVSGRIARSGKGQRRSWNKNPDKEVVTYVVTGRKRYGNHQGLYAVERQTDPFVEPPRER